MQKGNPWKRLTEHTRKASAQIPKFTKAMYKVQILILLFTVNIILGTKVLVCNTKCTMYNVCQLWHSQ